MNKAMKHQGIFVAGILLVFTVKGFANGRDAFLPGESNGGCAKGVSQIKGLSGPAHISLSYAPAMRSGQLEATTVELFGTLDNLHHLKNRQFYMSKGILDHSGAFTDASNFTFAFSLDTIEQARQHLALERNELVNVLRRFSPNHESSPVAQIPNNTLIQELAKNPKVREMGIFKDFLKVAYAEHFLSQLSNTHSVLNRNNYDPRINPKGKESMFPFRSRRIPIAKGQDLYFLNYKMAADEAKRTFAGQHPDLDGATLGIQNFFPVDENYRIDDASFLQNLGGVFPYRLASLYPRAP